MLTARLPPALCFPPATSFSLGLDLDIDMDAEDPTLTASLPTPAPYHAPQPNYSSSRQSALLASSSTQQTPTFRPDTALPYFFPFLHLDEKERSKGPKVQAQSMMELERGKPRSVGGFWKVDTEYVLAVLSFVGFLS